MFQNNFKFLKQNSFNLGTHRRRSGYYEFVIMQTLR